MASLWSLSLYFVRVCLFLSFGLNVGPIGILCPVNYNILIYWMFKFVFHCLQYFLLLLLLFLWICFICEYGIIFVVSFWLVNLISSFFPFQVLLSGFRQPCCSKYALCWYESKSDSIKCFQNVIVVLFILIKRGNWPSSTLQPWFGQFLWTLSMFLKNSRCTFSSGFESQCSCSINGPQTSFPY